MRRAFLLGLVILLVLALLTISAWYMLYEQDQDLYHHVAVGEPIVTERDANGTVVWDCRFDVTKVEVGEIYPPERIDEDIYWTEVRVQVTAPNGTVFIFNSPLVKENDALDPTLTAILIERAGGNSTIDVGDAIALLSLDARFASAHVALFYPVNPPGGHRDLMCDFLLPASFP